MANDDFDDNTPDEELDENQLIRRLRSQLKGREKQDAEAIAARRELAFVKAGIDTDSKLGRMFVRSFDGDISNLDALKAEAAEIGLIEKPAAPPAEDKSQGGKTDDSTEHRTALSMGANSDDGKGGASVREESFTAAQELLKQGGTFDVSAGELIARRAQAAMAGDLSVRFSPQQ